MRDDGGVVLLATGERRGVRPGGERLAGAGSEAELVVAGAEGVRFGAEVGKSGDVGGGGVVFQEGLASALTGGAKGFRVRAGDRAGAFWMSAASCSGRTKNTASAGRSA